MNPSRRCRRYRPALESLEPRTPCDATFALPPSAYWAAVVSDWQTGGALVSDLDPFRSPDWLPFDLQVRLGEMAPDQLALVGLPQNQIDALPDQATALYLGGQFGWPAFTPLVPVSVTFFGGSWGAGAASSASDPAPAQPADTVVHHPSVHLPGQPRQAPQPAAGHARHRHHGHRYHQHRPKPTRVATRSPVRPL